ncbi:MAG TPA: hypothetical protein PLH20_16335, partial [Flavobacterium sp.]|nr:hypothetical protein [Flavobacterium sp.]
SSFIGLYLLLSIHDVKMKNIKIKISIMVFIPKFMILLIIKRVNPVMVRASVDSLKFMIPSPGENKDRMK